MREKKRKKERNTTIFPFASCKSLFLRIVSALKENSVNRDSWWNFVQLLLWASTILKSLLRIAESLAAFLSRLKIWEKKKERKNFVIFAAIISPRYLYLFLPYFRISKDFWIYAVRKKERKRENESEWARQRERKKERIDNYMYICPVSEIFYRSEQGGDAARITPEDIILDEHIVCTHVEQDCVHIVCTHAEQNQT